MLKHLLGEKMKGNTLGELLKNIRKEKKWTIDQACKGICDRRTYIRWESNQREPSLLYFNLLSNHFNYDIYAYYKIFIVDQNTTALKYKNIANNYIKNNEWDSLFEFITKIQNTPELSSTENKMNIEFYFALYYCHFALNYELSASYCINALKKEDEHITSQLPIGNINSNIGLCLLNCLANNYLELKKWDLAIEIYISTLKHIENKIIPNLTYYQSFDFDKRMYQNTIHNLCQHYRKNGDISLALNYVNKGIQFSNKYNYLENLPDLLEIKFKLLYMKGDYTQSHKIFHLCVGLYELQDRLKEADYCYSVLSTEYPKLLA